MKGWIVTGVVALAVAAGGYYALTPPPAPASMLASAPVDAAAVDRGAYLARLGDCGACHTVEGGKPMAGGLAFATPMGVVYSTNITPDPKTGIGGYSLAQFEGALRRGVGGHGQFLYPAMPYTSFAKINDEDMKSLYAYFMKGVAPVEQAARPNAMRFPFNIRLGLGVWDRFFLDRSRFAPDPSKDAIWNRGAYIAEGLGHCGACHTPRGLAMQEKATREDGEHFLAGGEIDNWRAVSLRRPASETDIAQLLKTGANPHGAAFGPMTDVVSDSTQYFTDADRAALAHFLVSLSPQKPKAEATAAAAPPATLYTTRGGLGYYQFCAACHGRDGLGVPGVFPPLAANASIAGDRDAKSLIHLALTGWTSAKTESSPRGFTMPEFSSLSDQELAEVLSFVRGNFGNAGAPIAAPAVAALRATLSPKSTAPANFIVPRLADLLGRPNTKELVDGLRLMSETHALLPNNVGAELTCSSCHMDGGTIAHSSPYVGLAALFPTYNARAGRVISLEERLNGCFRRSMAGSPLADDSPQMRAMIAYMDWMKGGKLVDGKIPGRGTGKIAAGLTPDPDRGKALYKSQCAACHGEDGQGRRTADGDWRIPPLWGNRSYNIGAGMARATTAARFLKTNMPIAASTRFPQGQGALSDQDALDIAAFFTHQPRPDFPEKINDWPKGGRPKDSRY
jgi:thiosulfate dehydrogenase